MNKQNNKGGGRPGSGRKSGPPSKTISFRVPVFVDPIHETQLKGECKELIDEFIVGKERVQ